MPKIEGVLVADDAMPLQQGADGPRTHAWSHFDQRLRRRCGRQNELEVGKRACKQSKNQKNYQKTSHKQETLVDWILLLDFMMRFSFEPRNAP